MDSRPRVARPVIGICGVPSVASWGFWSQPAVLVASTYLDAVARVGGQPVILPPVPGADVEGLIDLVDGVLLAGGTDVEPEFYGEVRTDRTEETHRGRDLFEVQVAGGAMRRNRPILGICRGLQVLNVATGGTLHQHLLDAGYAEHRAAPGRLDAATHHGVETEPDSLLGACGLGGIQAVNSHHHQGVARLGVGGRVVARSHPDGAVEAVEWRDHDFALGVQWHPEDPATDGLFRGLVQAASRPRTPTSTSLTLTGRTA